MTFTTIITPGVATHSAATFTLIQFEKDVESDRRYALRNGRSEVGRGVDAAFRIDSDAVSKRHARLIVDGDQLTVEDLGSTNGTFVNGVRIQKSALVTGDKVQFANTMFRVELRNTDVNDGTIEQGLVQWAQTLLTFDTLLNDRRVVPFYQPIVSMDGLAIEGYEVLARSDLPEFPNPAAMFATAERLGQQAALSELMRTEGIRIAQEGIQCKSRIYLNTHPTEVITDRLIESLQRLRDRYHGSKITVEIHEAAVTELGAMKEFRRMLDDLDMELAYDDFGAGQGRLLELAEASPNVLKFDMQLIRGIDSAPTARYELLRSLVRYAADIGTIALAEGVETEAEHQACVQLGFRLGQGYLYGKPAAAH